MQRPGTGSVEVELVEADALDDDPAGPPATPGPSVRAALGRLPREVVLAAVAALLLGGTGVAVARAGAERALDARLAQVPGLSVSLAAPLREDWRVPGGGVVATTDDVVVHWDDDSLGVVGTDLRDGSTRYSVPGMCQLAPTEGDLSARFAHAGTAYAVRPGDVLLCVEGGGAGSPGEPHPADAPARVVDPATGETRHTIELVAGDLWDVVDGDVVSIGVDADRRVVAGRWSLESGEQRWAYRGTELAPEAADGWGSTMSDETMGLELGSWSETVDLSTGSRVGAGSGTATRGRVDEDEPEPAQTVPLRDGGSLVYEASPAGRVQTTVHPAGGGDPVTVPGLVPPPAVDDGSLAGAAVVLDVDGTAGSRGLGLVDLESGERRWTADVEGWEVGVLARTVLVTGAERTVAIDARTGRTRWESSTRATSSFGGWHLVTDGRRLLVLDGAGDVDGDGDRADDEVVALDVRTGERVWAITAPVSDAALVPLPDGTVLMVGAYRMVALRP